MHNYEILSHAHTAIYVINKMYCVSTCSNNYGQRSYLADNRHFFFYSVFLLSRPCLILICATSIVSLVPLYDTFLDDLKSHQSFFLHFPPFLAYVNHINITVSVVFFLATVLNAHYNYITHRANNASFF